MNNIGNFLHKFFNLEKDKNTKLSTALDIIKGKTGIELPRESIQIVNECLKISCNPVFRNEIFMHKSEIENDLKSRKIFLTIT